MRGTQYDLSNLFIKIQEIPDGVRVIDHHPELAVFMELSSTEDHVVRIAIALRFGFSGVLDSLVDGAAEHELAAQEAHCLGDRCADDRLA